MRRLGTAHQRESVATLDTGDRQPRLRINLSDNEAVEIERFGDELVTLYRGLPQPKSLVIILLTYDRQTRLAVTEAVAGALPGVVDKMRQAGGGLTRFEVRRPRRPVEVKPSAD